MASQVLEQAVGMGRWLCAAAGLQRLSLCSDAFCGQMQHVEPGSARLLAMACTHLLHSMAHCYGVHTGTAASTANFEMLSAILSSPTIRGGISAQA